MGQLTKSTFAILILFGFNPLALSDAFIFEMRKNLPLSDEEPVVKDFYLNAGSDSGLRTGQLVTVFRRQPLFDPVSAKMAGELYSPVGELELIHVQKGLSVGRVYQIRSGSEAPMLDYEAVMVGDRVDLSTARKPSIPLNKKEKEDSSQRGLLMRFLRKESQVDLNSKQDPLKESPDPQSSQVDPAPKVPVAPLPDPGSASLSQGTS